jgi:hypothetical protein
VKPNITSVEVHLQLSNNGHPVDDVLLVRACFTMAKNSNLPTTAKRVIMSISALQTLVKLCVCVCVCFFSTFIIYLSKFLN